MPTYCYRTADGRLVEHVCPMGKAPRTVHHEDGTVAHRDYASEMCRTQARDWSTGLESVAASVHVNQLANAKRVDKAMGVPTEYRPDGKWCNPVFRSRGHRKAYLRAHRMVDLDGGYGD